MQNRRIAIIGTVGIPAKYGGFETLAEYLTRYLGEDYNLTVYCSTKAYDKKLKYHNGAKLEYINLKANGVQSIFYDIISIFKSLKIADTLIILGVSGCIILPFLKLTTKKRMVVNLDGLEWKRDKWGKLARWFLKLSEKMAVKYADIIVVDNKVIQDYVYAAYNKRSTFIAYGADHVKKEPISDDLKALYPFIGYSYAFKVCRIEPENNIEMILEAFTEFQELDLVIVGNWTNSEYGDKLRLKYETCNNIHLVNPIYDQKVLNQLRSNCRLYIHGHSAGGTNPSLVEAMYLGLPIFAYDVDYNKETTKYKAKYFKNKFELISLLNNTDDMQLEKIGKELKFIAEKNYRWEKIALDYSRLF